MLLRRARSISASAAGGTPGGICGGTTGRTTGTRASTAARGGVDIFQEIRKVFAVSPLEPRVHLERGVDQCPGPGVAVRGAQVPEAVRLVLDHRANDRLC